MRTDLERDPVRCVTDWAAFVSVASRGELQSFAERFERRDIIVDGKLYLSRYYLAGTMPDNLAKQWDEPVTERWGRLGYTVHLHKFHLPDQDRTMHNHPWMAAGVVLSGAYTERRRVGPVSVGREVERTLMAGDVQILTPNTYHRVLELHGDVWTLFCHAKRVQGWGFD